MMEEMFARQVAVQPFPKQTAQFALSSYSCPYSIFSVAFIVEFSREYLILSYFFFRGYSCISTSLEEFCRRTMKNISTSNTIKPIGMKVNAHKELCSEVYSSSVLE